MAIARGEHEPARGEPKIWFTPVESLARLLSGRNRELLDVIARERPDSLTGLVELKRGGRGTLVPRVPCDQVRPDVSLTRPRPRIGI